MQLFEQQYKNNQQGGKHHPAKLFKWKKLMKTTEKDKKNATPI
jgi:hypothetical protein